MTKQKCNACELHLLAFGKYPETCNHEPKKILSPKERFMQEFKYDVTVTRSNELMLKCNVKRVLDFLETL